MHGKTELDKMQTSQLNKSNLVLNERQAFTCILYVLFQVNTIN